VGQRDKVAMLDTVSGRVLATVAVPGLVSVRRALSAA